MLTRAKVCAYNQHKTKGRKNMEWHQILHAVLSLIFVIGLLFLTLWIFKFCEQKGLKCKFIKDLNASRRIDILEKRAIDSRNQIVLLRADQTEYFVLLGQTGNLLLKTNSRQDKKDE